MKPDFLSEDFLLHSKTAQTLYHSYAENLPILDFHSHLPAGQIAEDKVFQNISQAWLYGDHYKWRAMRANGISERFCTGDATDEEKFQKWAETVPQTLRNPLYHWTHLGLKRYFKISGKLLNPESASSIYRQTSKKLNSQDFSVKNLIRKMNVKVICTTDDPVDDLKFHSKIKDQNFEISVFPTFRVDLALGFQSPEPYGLYLKKLEEASGLEIATFEGLVQALDKRHEAFHQIGCRLSDTGVETIPSVPFVQKDLDRSFQEVLKGKTISPVEIEKLRTALLLELSRLNSKRGWVQQFHIGALRNNNARLLKKVGKDAGVDSMGDFEIARPLSIFLNTLDTTNELAKTILYNLNPRDNELFATMAGNFQDGTIPGKVQHGSAWWFLDQKDGMEKQINSLSNMGLLSRFVGMVTDSRSFLSFPRHEYFRRILCNLIGAEVERGELPEDIPLLGGLIKNVSFFNAKAYLDLPLEK